MLLRIGNIFKNVFDISGAHNTNWQPIGELTNQSNAMAFGNKLLSINNPNAVNANELFREGVQGCYTTLLAPTQHAHGVKATWHSLLRSDWNYTASWVKGRIVDGTHYITIQYDASLVGVERTTTLKFWVDYALTNVGQIREGPFKPFPDNIVVNMDGLIMGPARRRTNIC